MSGEYPPVADAFTMFAMDQSRTPKTIRKRLVERRFELADIVSGGAAQDWAHYQRMVGHIVGLDEALAICAEVEKQLQEN